MYPASDGLCPGRDPGPRPPPGSRLCPPCATARRYGSAAVRRTPGHPARRRGAGRLAVLQDCRRKRTRCPRDGSVPPGQQAGQDSGPSPRPCRHPQAPAGGPAGPTTLPRPAPAATTRPADRLLTLNVLRQGFLLYCARCHTYDFYRIDQVGPTFECRACGHASSLTRGQWYEQDPERAPVWALMSARAGGDDGRHGNFRRRR